MSACCAANTVCCHARGSPHEQRASEMNLLIRENSRPTIVTDVPPWTGPPVGKAPYTGGAVCAVV
eukprot:3330696-Prymnesium_polylepis.1